MKRIKLTQGFEALIDDEFYEEISKVKWYASSGKHNKCRYAVRTVRDKKTGRISRLTMHRLIIGKPPKGMVVDHINQKSFDNRLSNLRFCTKAENAKNCRFSTRNTSGFRGVDYIKRTKKWRAVVRENGKARHLGYFSTPKEAHDAFVAASIKIYGKGFVPKN